MYSTRGLEPLFVAPMRLNLTVRLRAVSSDAKLSSRTVEPAVVVFSHLLGRERQLLRHLDRPHGVCFFPLSVQQ